MGVLIKGGTVVNAHQTVKADVYCEGDKIAAVGRNLEVPSGTKVIDADGRLVMPGGIDPHTHFELLFMGTVSRDDFFTGTAAGLAGGTTTIIDMCIPDPGQPLLDAVHTWKHRAEKAAADYSFHVAVSSWSERTSEEMGEVVRTHGIPSFKHFMAYKGAYMVDDDAMLHSFARARELGAIVNVHCENGDAVAYLQAEVLKSGVTGPEGHPLSRPISVEAEATNRVISIAQITKTPLYIVHVSCREALEAVSRARLSGQRVYAEVLGAHLTLDDSVYASPDFDQAAGFVMSPPFRPKGHCQALWNGLQAGHVQVVASDHVTFNKEQKRMGLGNFASIPNGTGGIEDRMSLVWDGGVRTGLLSPEEFVAVTSTNAAKIYNLWPQKGLIAPGADADVVIWDSQASKTISAATHHHATDFSIFEGKTVTGVPHTTLARGRVVYSDGQLKADRGAGRQIKRNAFGAAYAAAVPGGRYALPAK